MTCCLYDVITSDLNIVQCLWRCLCVYHHGMMTYALAPSHVFPHILYINSYLLHHFPICGYVKNKTFSLLSNTCAIMNKQIQMLYGRYITYAEYFGLGLTFCGQFWLDRLTMYHPVSKKDMQIPVWLFKLGYTRYVA